MSKPLREIIGVVGNTPDGRRKLGYVIADIVNLPFRPEKLTEKQAFIFPMSFGGELKI